MINDPRAIIAKSPMSRPQMVAVGMVVLLNALDGFDVLSISFASPGIAREWGIDRAALGIVLAMELLGMALGSLLLGQICDRVGRKRTILGCLVVITAGMGLAATAANVIELSLWRILTGLGMGGLLAAISAVAVEHANAKQRSLAVGFMATGYSIGAVVGGTLASALLVNHNWRAVFLLGSMISAVCIPLVWMLLPETVSWLAQHRPRGALDRINRTLAKFGHKPVDCLPDVEKEGPVPAFAALFTKRLAPVTLCLMLAYFMHIMTFYFVLKWAPKIVADFGYTASEAASVLVWANVGGLPGAIGFSLIAQRFGLRRLTIGAMLLSTATVAVFGIVGSDLTRLAISAAAASFATGCGVVGLYAIIAQSFPTAVRAGGTGLVIGLGRGGAALSPMVPGYLFVNGVTLPTVALLMGLGSLVAAIALLLMGARHGLVVDEAAAQ